jgi:hypothetical protein
VAVHRVELHARHPGVLDERPAQRHVELGDPVGAEPAALQLARREVRVDAHAGDDLGEPLGVEQRATLDARLQDQPQRDAQRSDQHEAEKAERSEQGRPRQAHAPHA